MYQRILIILTIAICAIGQAIGQPRSEAHGQPRSELRTRTLEDTVRINFRQSKTYLDTAYMDNRAALQHVRQSVERFHRPDSNYVLVDVKVTGGASPEGSVNFNDWLSKERAARIYDYLKKGFYLPDSITSFTLLGRDWEGLRRKAEADPNLPDKESVLETLDHIIATYKARGKQENSDLVQLKSLNHGIPYQYLYKHIFPSLRESNIVLTFDVPQYPAMRKPDMPLNIDLVAVPVMPELIVVEQPERKKPFYMALKTNMLSDLLAVPEGGIEFYLGKNYSIVGNWMYGWWDKDNVHRYWRIYGGDLALRRWFGKAAAAKPLTGHHLGLYGGVVTYDFEFGGKGYMGGVPGRPLWTRCNWYCGVEYGYSLPIARRLNIDFTLGLGYLGGKYIEYEPKGKCYVWEATKHLNYFGPTKLEVSLTWLIGRGNFNIKKGGAK